MLVLSTILFPNPTGMAALPGALGLTSHSPVVQPLLCLCIPTSAKVLGPQALHLLLLPLPASATTRQGSKWDVGPSAASRAPEHRKLVSWQLRDHREASEEPMSPIEEFLCPCKMPV